MSKVKIGVLGAKTAGDMLLPTFSKGTPDIDDVVYRYMKEKWDAECESEDDGYRNAAFTQGAGTGI